MRLGCPTEQAEILPGLPPPTVCPDLGPDTPELRGIFSVSQQGKHCVLQEGNFSVFKHQMELPGSVFPSTDPGWLILFSLEDREIC